MSYRIGESSRYIRIINNERTKDRYRQKDLLTFWLLEMSEMLDWSRMRMEHGIDKPHNRSFVDCERNQYGRRGTILQGSGPLPEP